MKWLDHCDKQCLPILLTWLRSSTYLPRSMDCPDVQKEALWLTHLRDEVAQKLNRYFMYILDDGEAIHLPKKNERTKTKKV